MKIKIREIDPSLINWVECWFCSACGQSINYQGLIMALGEERIIETAADERRMMHHKKCPIGRCDVDWEQIGTHQYIKDVLWAPFLRSLGYGENGESREIEGWVCFRLIPTKTSDGWIGMYPDYRHLTANQIGERYSLPPLQHREGSWYPWLVCPHTGGNQWDVGLGDSLQSIEETLAVVKTVEVVEYVSGAMFPACRPTDRS